MLGSPMSTFLIFLPICILPTLLPTHSHLAPLPTATSRSRKRPASALVRLGRPHRASLRPRLHRGALKTQVRQRRKVHQEVVSRKYLLARHLVQSTAAQWYIPASTLAVHTHSHNGINSEDTKKCTDATSATNALLQSATHIPRTCASTSRQSTNDCDMSATSRDVSRAWHKGRTWQGTRQPSMVCSLRWTGRISTSRDLEGLQGSKDEEVQYDNPRTVP